MMISIFRTIRITNHSYHVFRPLSHGRITQARNTSHITLLRFPELPHVCLVTMTSLGDCTDMRKRPVDLWR